MKASIHNARWVVVNVVIKPEDGNGVWAFCFTKIGAAKKMNQILSFREGSGFYTIPSGGLTIKRWR